MVPVSQMSRKEVVQDADIGVVEVSIDRDDDETVKGSVGQFHCLSPESFARARLFVYLIG